LRLLEVEPFANTGLAAIRLFPFLLKGLVFTENAKIYSLCRDVHCPGSLGVRLF
jgi:hypothetical protein